MLDDDDRDDGEPPRQERRAEQTLAKTDGDPHAIAQDEVAVYRVDPGNRTVLKLAR